MSVHHRFPSVAPSGVTAIEKGPAQKDEPLIAGKPVLGAMPPPEAYWMLGMTAGEIDRAVAKGTPALLPTPTTTEPAPPRGSVNPFALAQIAAPGPIDWSKEPKPNELVERLLGMSFAEILSPQNELIWPSPQNGTTRDAALRALPWNPPRIYDRLDGLRGTSTWMSAGEFAPGGFDWFDAHQGAVPNCHFIAALQAIAQTMPGSLPARSSALAGGWRRFSLWNGVEWATFNVSEKVPAFTPDGRSYSITTCAGSSRTQTSSLVGREIGWPGVFEKVFAVAGLGVMHDLPNLQLPSYWVARTFTDGLPWDTVPPLEALTGIPERTSMLAGRSAGDVYAFFRSLCDARGLPLVPVKTGTVTSDSASAEEWYRAGLVPFHAYSVCGAFELDGARYIVLRNTWGNFVPSGPGTVGGIWNGRPLGVGGLFAFEASRVRQWFEGVHYLPR